ncbi:MAG: hypothetical protein GTO71_13895 [Woeseiaceae bacterium]|nr:hypothetical protein [Woeseiaceae bacterium]NIP22149.1 hypothetical protein [Woeseiaceae bacterium]NIS91316.1 hypothetical protein [Woeseiaceae bacterium]
MRFAEVFLRLGITLVAWMMLFTYALWLAAAHVVECGPDGDELYRLLLGLAPFTVAFAFAIRVTRPFADIHSMLRWLGAPLGLLLLLGLRTIWSVLSQVNIGAVALCGADEPALWQQAWAPLQLATVFAVAILVFREMIRPR